ncbi:hypothetical protein [uncultured Clostridium sp.]|uniref:hypothetical protein n=1 Tax=uncultured Clostridium sp. TaxID=59620 RepID=UPI00262AE729|nr:hypothetical protein [uncultured Clostridium sp.]
MSRIVKIIKEAYEVHDTLNPKLFDLDTNKLKPEVLQKLNEIFEEFLKQIDPLTLSVADVQFVGSNAGYNYNDNSDIDLHLIVNFDLNYIDDELLQSIYNDKKNDFNKKYDLELYNIPVEVYIEDIKSMNASSGVYSILKNEWVKEPEPIEYDVPDYSKEAKEAKAKVNEVLKSEDPQLIEDTINGIYMSRKVGLSTEGEMSIGNLVFKELRNEGLLDGLRNKYYELRSNELSLESLKRESLNEDYRNDIKYQDLLARLKELKIEEQELKSKKPEERKISDEEMRKTCEYSEEQWKELSRAEKEFMYDIYAPNEEENNYYEKLTEIQNEISKIHDTIGDIKKREFSLQGGNIYKGTLPRESTKDSYECFNLDTNEYHQDYLENIDYAKSKGYNGAFIAEMSPDEYMDRCSKEVFKTPLEDTYDGMERKDDTDEYAEMMKNGTKFDMPYIDTLNKNQEGRHRALAAKQLGIKTIPVLYLY